MDKIIIDAGKCKKCGACVQICPLAVFELKDRNSKTEARRADLCISCGQCVSLCSQAAIAHADFPPEKIVPIVQETMPSYAQTLELLRSRRSVRTYREKPVEKEIIEQIVGGACLAPSAENYQSTEYLIVQNRDVLARISVLTAEFVSSLITGLRQKAASPGISGKEEHALKSMEWLVEKQQGGRDMFLFGAPCLIVFHSSSDVSYPDISSNLALQNAALISHSLGVGGFYAGYALTCSRQDARIAELLAIPQGNRITGMLTAGYPKFKFKNWVVRKAPGVRWL